MMVQIHADYEPVKNFKLNPELKPQGKVTLYHLSDPDFEAAARRLLKVNETEIKKKKAFAVWGKTWWGFPIKSIYMRAGHERTLVHELLHFQEGQYHA